MEVTNEYARLAEAFNEAAAKELLEPRYDPARGSNIEIQLSSGHRHGLGDLSSGEQEMLALLYFVRRLSAAGGILCLDEPEQHLHPTLQAALFEGMRDVASRAQVLVVSHSVNLIAAAPMAGLVQVGTPASAELNQASRLRDEPARAQLMAELDITPADLLQSDMLLVVEGDTDSQVLRAMFPVELGRVHSVVAGSGRQVLAAYDILDKTPAGVPWLCLRDRDLLTDNEVTQLEQAKPRLHIWPRRAIESNLLYAPLIAAVFESMGRLMTVPEAQQALDDAAAPLQEEVLAGIVQAELSRQVPAPSAATVGNRFDKMAAQLREYAEVNTLRAHAVTRVAEEQRVLLDGRWASDWSVLVDPKVTLKRLTSALGIFQTVSDLTAALIARVRDDPEVRPSSLEDFRARIAAILAS